jgi:hypothetical protein
VKISVKLFASLMMLSIACSASHATPKRPWRVEVKTDGGFAGRGIGTYAIDSDGNAAARLMNGRECTFQISADGVEALLANARPSEWKEDYLPENKCCDRVEYTLTYDEAGAGTTTKWIDDPLPMPADLVALSNAIVGGDATSIRMLATERCK